MTKKHARTKQGDRGPLVVLSADGRRRRFLRGMMTHHLVQRGLSFDDAYAVARAVRGRLSDRDEVTTAELRDLVAGQLDGPLGQRLRPLPSGEPAGGLKVVYHGQTQPFSRGLLARSMQAAGVDLDRAYRLVSELEANLRAEGISRLPSGEIALRVGDLLESFEGDEAARQYRMVRRIHRLPRPLVIYIGGASGTGKSTLALELAPLLRIYRINATDTIRQVMRMVFTPSILPALHISSFEVAASGEPGVAEERLGSPRDPEFAQRLIATFEEQATRVCVGVRAVVERALAENMSIVVEGAHVHPGMVPFGDLRGSVYQLPMVLATSDAETHRARFLSRSRAGGRRAERYLESFGAIRIIHDYILQLAEDNEQPLLDTSQESSPVLSALRMVTSVLESKLHEPGTPVTEEVHASIPTLLLVIDGLADRPVRALGGRTPLQAASTPTLDRLAREGQCGLADPVAPGVVPDTAAGSLALFAQSPLALKRGPVEALGAGIALSQGDIALRGNFATLDPEGRVIDRRAGRIREEAAELAVAIDRLHLPGGVADDVEVRVEVGTEHRLAIVLRGEDLSSAIHGSDPGDGAAPGPPLVPRPADPEDERATYTATALTLFEQEARKVLAEHPINRRRAGQGLPLANAVLTRGAGRIHRLLPLEEAGVPLRVSCISGDRTLLGLASWLGADAITSKKMTANLDTDLKAKFRAALGALQRDDLVVLHVKGADIAAHDRRPDLKVAFLEQVDRQLGNLVEAHPEALRIAVASDHATLSESGQHAADPLPVLLWGEGLEADEVEAFDETSVAGGRLQRFPLQMLLSRLYRLS